MLIWVCDYSLNRKSLAEVQVELFEAFVCNSYYLVRVSITKVYSTWPGVLLTLVCFHSDKQNSKWFICCKQSGIGFKLKHCVTKGGFNQSNPSLMARKFALVFKFSLSWEFETSPFNLTLWMKWHLWFTTPPLLQLSCMSEETTSPLSLVSHFFQAKAMWDIAGAEVFRSPKQKLFDSESRAVTQSGGFESHGRHQYRNYML